jgi:hypothetical protein
LKLRPGLRPLYLLWSPDGVIPKLWMVSKCNCHGFLKYFCLHWECARTLWSNHGVSYAAFVGTQNICRTKMSMRRTEWPVSQGQCGVFRFFLFFLLCRKQGQIVKSADSTRKFLRFLPWGQKRVKGSPDPINGSIWHRRSRLEYGREMNS